MSTNISHGYRTDPKFLHGRRWIHTVSDSDTTVRALGPPIPPVVFEYLINPLISLILRSPLHGLLSEHVLLVSVRGRRTGRRYTTPVGYERVNDTLYVTSQTDRTWWKNLRGGAEVALRLRGDRRDGRAEVIEDDAAVADYVYGFLERHGLDSASRLALEIEGESMPDRETLAAGLDETVVVRIELGS